MERRQIRTSDVCTLRTWALALARRRLLRKGRSVSSMCTVVIALALSCGLACAADSTRLRPPDFAAEGCCVVAIP